MGRKWKDLLKRGEILKILLHGQWQEVEDVGKLEGDISVQGWGMSRIAMSPIRSVYVGYILT